MTRKFIINRSVSVFDNFRYLSNLNIFRIMESKGIARVMVSQPVLVNVDSPQYLYDQKHFFLLSLCVNDCGRPDLYEQKRRVAVFFHLRQIRYWIPRPLACGASGQEILTEWAEYDTDKYEIDFARYNQLLKGTRGA